MTVMGMMIVVVRVIMAMSMIVAMSVVVTMVLRRRDIGAAFRIERRLDGDNARAEALEQGSQGRVAAQADATAEDLHRHMAVAEMPGEPRQRHRIGGARLDQRLGLGHDLDHAPVGEQQAIAHAQGDRLGEIELAAGPLDADHDTALYAAPGRIKNDGIDRSGGRSGRNNGGHLHRQPPGRACRARGIS